MNPYWAVLVVFLLSAVGAWISYTPRLLNAGWAPWVMTLLCLPGGALWTWGCRKLTDSTQIYTFSLVWDLAIFAAYYVFPLLITATPSPRVLVGAGIVIVGVLVAKS